MEPDTAPVPAAPELREPTTVETLRALLERAAPQWRAAVWFGGILFAASFLDVVALVCLYAGFSAMGDPDAGGQAAWAGRLLHLLGHDQPLPWGLYLLGFAGASLAAAGLEHLAWVLRLHVLSRFEAELMEDGTRALFEGDPRDRAGHSRREVMIALRGDAKSARVVFQLLLLAVVSVLQVAWPLVFLMSLNAPMALAGVGFVLFGLLPVYVLVRRTSALSFTRQDRSIGLGLQVSSFLANLGGPLQGGGSLGAGLSRVDSALAEQQALWRHQYQTRSLAQRLPQVFSVGATYGMILWGVLLIDAGGLDWAGVMGIVVASRVVFQPFTSLAGRWVKTAEHWPRAARHLAFVDRLRGAGRPPAQELVPDAGPTPLARIEAQGLAPAGEPSRGDPPLDLALERGSLLAVIDPAIGLDNPLYVQLAGRRRPPVGCVRWNGQDLDGLRFTSFSGLVGLVGGAPPPRGASLIEAVRAADPGTGREALEAFCADLLGPGWREVLPRGVDEPVGAPEGEQSEAELAATFAARLHALEGELPGLLVVDAFRLPGRAAPAMAARFVERVRPRTLTFWLDRRPPPLAPDTRVWFENGRFRGTGDAPAAGDLPDPDALATGTDAA